MQKIPEATSSSIRKTSKSAERIWLAFISYITPRTPCVSICKFVLMCWLQARSVQLEANRPNFLPISAPAVPAPSPNSGTKPFYRPSNRPLLYIYNVHARRASHFTTNYESWHISYMCSATKSCTSIESYWIFFAWWFWSLVIPTSLAKIKKDILQHFKGGKALSCNQVNFISCDHQLLLRIFFFDRAWIFQYKVGSSKFGKWAL